MKSKYWVLFISICFCGVFLKGQTTLELETGKVSTLVFDEEVIFFNSSLNSTFVAFRNDANKLLVSALKDFDKAVLSIELADGTIKVIDCIAKNNNPFASFFLDFRSQDSPDSPKAKDSKSFRSVENNVIVKDKTVIARVGKNMRVLEKQNRVNARDLGFYTYGIKGVINKVYSDKDHLYLSVLVKNESAMVYEIDFINFTYRNTNRKRLFGRDDVYDIDVFPTQESEVSFIKPYKDAVLNFAIPIFSLGRRSSLIILISEQNGFRNIEIPINGRRLLTLLK